MLLVHNFSHCVTAVAFFIEKKRSATYLHRQDALKKNIINNNNNQPNLFLMKSANVLFFDSPPYHSLARERLVDIFSVVYFFQPVVISSTL